MLRLSRLLIYLGIGIVIPIGAIFKFQPLAQWTLFIITIIYVLHELFKILLEKKIIDNSFGIGKILFCNEPKQDYFFQKVSLVTAKGWNKFWLWFVFMLSILIASAVVFFLVSR
jgi:hypothetical protein